MSSITYLAEIESTIAGIPCRIGVKEFLNMRGSHSHNAPSDLDYYGYIESEWDVLDRNGRPAAWLERKLTDADRERIERKIEYARID